MLSIGEKERWLFFELINIHNWLTKENENLIIKFQFNIAIIQ